MAPISIDRLVKRWGSVVALDELSLEIADKELLVLLGPSGCGKTTTMRIVAGLDDATSGEIRIDGVRINDVTARDRDLAMVFQNYGLYPHMTVAQNIGYPLKVRGLARSAREARVRAAAEKVQLAHLLDRRPAQLSGGQRQRVALARAIVRTPRLFLMDEPLSNLDAKLRTSMRAELKHLQRELATTTIYVTHDQIEAMTLADRIAILNGGRLQQHDTPAEIYARPANVFVASFIGSPPMNLIEGECDSGAFVHSGGRIAGAPARTGRIVLGQRPEDVRIAEPGAGHLDGEVFSSELLGDSALIGVKVGGDIVNVKVGPQEGRALGERVGLRFDPAKLHAFNTATGERLKETRAC